MAGRHDDNDKRVTRLFFGSDGIQLPVLAPIEGITALADSAGVRAVCHVIAGVLADAAPGGSAVIAMTRSGGGSVTPRDQWWSCELHEVAGRAAR